MANGYLSRWPYQEDLFRRGRNGTGLERSHGYGVSRVTNVAVIGKRENAARKLCKSIHEVLDASEPADMSMQKQAEAKTRLKEKREHNFGKPLDRRHELGVRQAKQRFKDRERALREAERKQDKATKEYKLQRSMPDEIYVRDTALDSIVTCLKMALLALFVFVDQEYLGGRRIIMPGVACGGKTGEMEGDQVWKGDSLGGSWARSKPASASSH